MSNTGNTGSAVATITSGANTSNPTIVFKSVGSFSIRADASYSSNYTIAHTISEPIEVTKDKPIVKFSSIYDPSYPYQYSTPYEFVNAPAYIQNNTGQTLKYSIVTDDSTVKSFKPSNIATITNDGTSFVTNTVGKFKIRAYTPKTLNSDFGSGSALSDTIEIIKIKPTILQYPQIILTPPVTSSTLVYRQPYTINPLPITVTGIATQYIMLGTGAYNYNYNTLWYANYCVDVTGSTCHAEYRLRFSNGIVSNLTLTSDSPGGLTNPDLLFALSNVPFDGVTAILQGLNISTGSDNLWYDIDVPEQFITQDQSTVTFSGSSGTGNFKSTPSLFQASVSTISSNTDTNPPPNINYTSSDETVATISGSNVTIVGIGHFYILVTVSPTTNYTQILRSASPQKYETIQATPTITSFPTTALSAQKWNYNQPYPGIIPIANNIPTTNTDTNGPLITYSTNDANIATISGNTINITGVDNFQILVTIHSTTNFSTVTYTYPSGLVYNSDTTYTSYNAEPATPIIKFPKKFITSSRYGSTYIFVPAEISNSDPSSQTLTYSIINSKPVVASTTPVATLKYKSGVINPSVVINSVGTFQIQASCLASENGYYLGNNTPSLIITISKEIPNIVFNTSSFKSSYTCQPTKPYSLTTPIASITNNKAQLLTYSIVETDGDTPSNIASISSDGTSLTTNSVGSFQIFATPIFATPTAVANGDYGKQGKASETIKIESATPTVITFPTLPSTFTYGNTYPIPYTTTPPYPIVTSNTDTAPGPLITYSSSNATISGSVTCLPNTAIYSINGTTITPVGVGSFQIIVTIGATANYNQATYSFPSTYTSIPATPTISPFPSNYGSTWGINGTYNLTSTVTTNAGSGYTVPNAVIYSIINPSVSNIATISTSGTQILIKDVGTFQIQASLAETPNFKAAVSVQSNTITIVTVNVSILSNNFSNFVYGGGPYTLSVTTNNTDTNPAPTITYSISPQSSSTGNGTISGNSLTITAAGGACIYVTITATENFYATTIPVSVNIAQAPQTIVLNSSLNIYTTIGSQFGCSNIVSPSLSNNPSPSYSYTITTVSSNSYSAATPIYPNYPTTAVNYAVVTIDSNYNITCISPGAFVINITAASTANFSQTTVSTPTIYVSIVPEVIIFNNPQTFPPSASVSGEVGMAINIPTTNQYPFGFQNYSALTITNSSNGATFTINANTLPTYFNINNLYMVFFEPATTGSFSQNLTANASYGAGISSTANIAYVGNNSIANGIASGQQIVFTFSGNTLVGGGAAGPNTLTINWNPGSLNITPGLVYGAYYTLGNPPIVSSPYDWLPSLPNGNGVTVSTLNSGGITGYYIVPWAGYNTNSITGGLSSYFNAIISSNTDPNWHFTILYNDVNQAWGMWYYVAGAGNTYASTTSLNQNGINYYYVGIPQMANPLFLRNFIPASYYYSPT